MLLQETRGVVSSAKAPQTDEKVAPEPEHGVDTQIFSSVIVIPVEIVMIVDKLLNRIHILLTANQQTPFRVAHRSSVLLNHL